MVPSPGSAAAVVPGHGRREQALPGGAHAAEACVLPFRAGRSRPRPGCRLLCVRPDTHELTDHITRSDREFLGERAPRPGRTTATRTIVNGGSGPNGGGPQVVACHEHGTTFRGFLPGG